MLCTRIVEPNDEIAIQSLDTLKKIVKDSTTSMTSVPKPFKFLKEHYKNLTAHYDRMTPSFLKVIFAFKFKLKIIYTIICNDFKYIFI